MIANEQYLDDILQIIEQIDSIGLEEAKRRVYTAIASGVATPKILDAMGAIKVYENKLEERNAQRFFKDKQLYHLCQHCALSHSAKFECQLQSNIKSLMTLSSVKKNCTASSTCEYYKYEDFEDTEEQEQFVDVSNEDYYDAYSWYSKLNSYDKSHLDEDSSKYSKIIRRMQQYPVAHKINQLFCVLKHCTCLCDKVEAVEFITQNDIRLQDIQIRKDSINDICDCNKTNV